MLVPANERPTAFKSLTEENLVMKALRFCKQLTGHMLLANNGKSDTIKEFPPIWLGAAVLQEKKTVSFLGKDLLVPSVHYKKKG